MNKISYEHMQFLVESTINDLFKKNEDHGWTYEEYITMSTQLAMIQFNDNQQSNERYLN